MWYYSGMEDGHTNPTRQRGSSSLTRRVGVHQGCPQGNVLPRRGYRGYARGKALPMSRSSAMPPRLELPEQFGRYRILKLLGEGGMGAVYLAEDTKLHRQVAVKVPKLTSDEDIQRFEREARVAA